MMTLRSYENARFKHSSPIGVFRERSGDVTPHHTVRQYYAVAHGLGSCLELCICFARTHYKQQVAKHALKVGISFGKLSCLVWWYLVRCKGEVASTSRDTVDKLLVIGTSEYGRETARGGKQAANFWWHE